MDVDIVLGRSVKKKSRPHTVLNRCSAFCIQSMVGFPWACLLVELGDGGFDFNG